MTYSPPDRRRREFLGPGSFWSAVKQIRLLHVPVPDHKRRKGRRNGLLVSRCRQMKISQTLFVSLFLKLKNKKALWCGLFQRPWTSVDTFHANLVYYLDMQIVHHTYLT